MHLVKSSWQIEFSLNYVQKKVRTVYCEINSRINVTLIPLTEWAKEENVKDLLSLFIQAWDKHPLKPNAMTSYETEIAAFRLCHVSSRDMNVPDTCRFVSCNNRSVTVRAAFHA